MPSVRLLVDSDTLPPDAVPETSILSVELYSLYSTPFVTLDTVKFHVSVIVVFVMLNIPFAELFEVSQYTTCIFWSLALATGKTNTSKRKKLTVMVS
jgi:hypothetical protein